MDQADQQLSAQIVAVRDLISRGDIRGALQALARPVPGSLKLQCEKQLFKVTALSLSGDQAAARDACTLLLEQGDNTQKAWALIFRACEMAQRGERRIAAQCFFQAIAHGVPAYPVVSLLTLNVTPSEYPIQWIQDKFPVFFTQADTVAAVRDAFADALKATAIPDVRAQQHDPLFHNGDGVLTELHEQLIETTLAWHWAREERGEIPLPQAAGVYAMHRRAVPPSVRVAVAAPSRYGAKFQRAGQANEFVDHYAGSARSLGLNTRVIGLDMERFESDPGRFHADLMGQLAQARTSLLIWDGSWVPAASAADLRRWKQVLRARDIKLAVFIPDSDETYRDLPAIWQEVGDVFLLPVEKRLHLLRLQGDLRVVSTVGHCVDPALLAGMDVANKPLDFFYAGSYRRRRHGPVQALGRLARTSWITGHGEAGKSLVTTADYFAKLREAKLTFNNAHQGLGEITNGRLVEAACAGVVVLQLDSPASEKILKPFIHYIPVANQDQAVQYAGFLWKHPHWCRRIGAAAAAFCQEYYGARAIYAAVIEKAHLT